MCRSPTSTAGSGNCSPPIWPAATNRSCCGKCRLETSISTPENNTNGYYQDNLAEYIFSHIAQLILSGCYWRGLRRWHVPGTPRRVTLIMTEFMNPASFFTADGVSSGQICNNHTATVSDDDGGFIRMSAKTYHQRPGIAQGRLGSPHCDANRVTGGGRGDTHEGRDGVAEQRGSWSDGDDRRFSNQQPGG